MESPLLPARRLWHVQVLHSGRFVDDIDTIPCTGKRMWLCDHDVDDNVIATLTIAFSTCNKTTIKSKIEAAKLNGVTQYVTDHCSVQMQILSSLCDSAAHMFVGDIKLIASCCKIHLIDT